MKKKTKDQSVTKNKTEKQHGIIRTLAKSVRQYKVYAIVNPLFMIGETLCECLIPYVIGRLINAIGGECR